MTEPLTDDERVVDPLVRVWTDPTHPLNWRAWVPRTDAELARLRTALMYQLRDYEPLPPGNFWWRSTHQELLEIKAATGHGRMPRPRPQGAR